MATESRLSPGSEAVEVPASLAVAPTAGPEEASLSDAELVRQLRQRVGVLEERARTQPPKREVVVTARTVMEILGMIVGVVLLVGLVYVAWGAITLVLVALLAALALSPAVEFFVCRGLRRGWAAALVFLLAVMAVGLLGLVLIPPLVTQVSHFIHSLPATLSQLSKGHGPLGFLERKFHVVEEANKLISGKGAGSSAAAGVAGSGIGVALGVVDTVIGLIVIAFLTFFMLLEGPKWVERFLGLLPDGVRPRYQRIGSGISRTVGGFVSGNLLASVLAGAVTAGVLFAAGMPYPVPLGVMVGFLDLFPIFGAFVAIAIIAAVSFFHGLVTGLVVTGVVFLYHQVEVYYLRPVIYGRMIELSPLAILVIATIGTALAGPLGAIAAIPVGGAIQVILVEILDSRAQRNTAARQEAIVNPAAGEANGR